MQRTVCRSSCPAKMLKWTSKPSVYKSSDSVPQPSAVSFNNEQDLLGYKMADGSSTGSQDNIRYHVTSGHSDDVVSDDFVMFRNNDRIKGNDFDKPKLEYTESDMKWTLLSIDNVGGKKNVKPSSLSLPASPVENKNKSKNDGGSSKSGILTRFKKIFSKSSKERISKSLPSSPKRSRVNMETLHGKHAVEKIEGGKRSHTRLERLIESKRKRRKTMGQERDLCVKTSISKRDANDVMKSKISHPQTHSEYKNEEMGDAPNAVGPGLHTHELQVQAGLIEKSKSSQLISRDQNQIGLLPRSSSFQHKPSVDDRKPTANRVGTPHTARNSWNKRYSDTFIEIQRSGDQKDFIGVHPNWFGHTYEQTNRGKRDTYNSDVIYPNPVSDTHRTALRKPGRNGFPFMDPVIIKSTKESLRPCNDMKSPRNDREKLQSPRLAPNSPLGQSSELREGNSTSKHTKNNNNGHHLLQKQTIDEMAIRTDENEVWASPLDSVSHRTNCGGDIPFAIYRENIRKVQQSSVTSKTQASVRDMVRCLEEKIIQTSPSQTNARSGKTPSGQMSPFNPMNISDSFIYSPNTQKKSHIENAEDRMLASFYSHCSESTTTTDESYAGDAKGLDNRSFEIPISPESSPENQSQLLRDDETNKDIISETTGSVWEHETISLTSQIKTSGFDVNFPTSPTRSMMTSLSEVGDRGNAERQESDISSPSTISKMALDAREYCDSSSTSFTSSLNVRLVQNEKFLSDKSSLSSCMESISATSLQSNVPYAHKPSGLDGDSTNLQRDLSRIIGEDKNPRYEDDVCHVGYHHIDEEIQACINVTTSEYVNKLADSIDSSAKDTGNGRTDDTETVDVHVTQKGHQSTNETCKQEGNDLVGDEAPAVCSHEDLHSPSGSSLNDFFSISDNKGLAQYNKKQEVGEQLSKSPSPMDVTIDGGPSPMHCDGTEGDMDCCIQDPYHSTEKSEALKSDHDKNRPEEAVSHGHNEVMSNEQLRSFVDEGQGMIIFTMPDFSTEDNTQDKQVRPVDKSIAPQKRVSFKMETDVTSTTSNDSSDIALLDGKLSEDSTLPDEEGDKVFESERSPVEPCNHLAPHQRKVTRPCPKDGEMPHVQERSPLERSVSYEKVTSQSSMGVSDISWFLEPCTPGFMGIESLELPVTERLSKLASLDVLPGEDITELYPSDVLDGCRVCDIEEPSLVMNTCIEDTHLSENSMSGFNTKEDLRLSANAPDKLKMHVINTVMHDMKMCPAEVVSRKAAMELKGKGRQGESTEETKHINSNKLSDVQRPKMKEIECTGTKMTTEKNKEDVSNFDNENDWNQRSLSLFDGKAVDTIISSVGDKTLKHIDNVIAIDHRTGLGAFQEHSREPSAIALNKQRAEYEDVDGDYYVDDDDDDTNNDDYDDDDDGDDFVHDDNSSKALNRDFIISDNSPLNREDVACPAIEELRQSFQDKRECIPSDGNLSLEQDVGMVDCSDSTPMSWPCHENDIQLDGQKEKKQRGQEGHSSASLLSSESPVTSKSMEIHRVRRNLSAKRKNRMSHGLQISGVEKRDADLFMSNLSIDSSGDCIDSEEEIHSSVTDDIATAIVASKENFRLERHQKRTRPIFATRRRKNRSAHMMRRQTVNDDECTYVDLESPDRRDINIRRSQSDHNLFDRSFELRSDAFVWDDGHGDRAEHRRSLEMELNLGESSERTSSLETTTEASDVSQRQEVHWMTAVLNHRPGQWLFLATFMFFQLLFHCIYVK